MKSIHKKHPLFLKLAVWVNVFFMLLYVLSVIAGWINPSSFPLFSIFGLLYPPLLIINVLFIIFWIIFNPKNIFISIWVILVSYSTLTDNVQFSSSQGDYIKDNNIKILSYNIQRFGLDISEKELAENQENIVHFLESENADILCLQEFHGKGHTLYEPLLNMKKTLGSESYYYESYFNPRYEQITGLAIFSKYKAVNRGKLKFDGSRTFGIYTDVLLNDDTLRIYNIHLASIQLTHSDIDFVVTGGQDQEEFKYTSSKIYNKLTEAFQLREQQMMVLWEEVYRSPYPVILAGDFNDTPSSYIYNQITVLLKDTFVEKGNGFGITHAGQIPFLRIDYIMHNDDFETKAYSRIKNNFSDHYPISAIIQRN